jgi:DNA-binding response OmpR family regulator
VENASPPHVLIVDDDRHARLIIRNLMLEDNWRVSEAANGQAALEAYARIQPDLVLLDIMMPVMEGLEVCARLRADAERRHVLLIVISALDDAPSINQAFEAGATDIITKPYNLMIVRERLRRLLRAKQLEDASRRAKHEWEATLDMVSDLVLLTGPDDRVVRCNRPVSLHFAVKYAEVLGRTLAELFYGERQAAPEFYQAQAGPLQFPRLPGWYALANYPVTLADNRRGAVHVVRDVTPQVELEAARASGTCRPPEALLLVAGGPSRSC